MEARQEDVVKKQLSVWILVMTMGVLVSCTGGDGSADIGTAGDVNGVEQGEDVTEPELDVRTEPEEIEEPEETTGSPETMECPEGDPCDDGDQCTTGDSCQAGECVGEAMTCDDGLDCTVDSCLEGECVNEPAEGFCLVGSECLSDGEPLLVNPCLGCVVAESTDSWSYLSDIPCEDDDPCTTDDFCQGGACTGIALACDDNLDCTEDACLDGECVSELIAEHCLIDGLCHAAGEKPEQDDEGHWECQVCDPEADATEWSPAAGSCGKENSCVDHRTCEDGLCVDIETPFCSTSQDPPCQETVCDADLDECVLQPLVDGTLCDDGNGCTEGDSCLEGVCSPGALTCDCLVNEDCAVFEDEDLCNGTLVCAEDNTCLLDAETVVQCEADTGNECTVNECAPETGVCAPVPVSNGSDCDDGLVCTEDDACQEGECVGNQVDCDDGNVCTNDICDPDDGCKHLVNILPCEDGNPCTSNDMCNTGQCVGGLPTDCDNGNECTSDTCDPLSGCVHDPLEGPCSDGNECTKSDKCVAGECTGSAQYCDDNEPCTIDSCDPEEGCVFMPTEDCDDVTVAPVYTLVDHNPTSPTYQQEVTPTDDFGDFVYMFMLHDPG